DIDDLARGRPLDISVSENAISFRVDQAGGGQFEVVDSFNGYVLSDENATVRPISGVEVSAGTNSLGVPASNVFYNTDTIYVDVDGLDFRNGDRLDLTVSFSSASSVLAAEDDANYVARLYTAAFGREPDADGLNFWIGALPSVGSREAMAELFVNSDEFSDLFGSPDTLGAEGFVDRLYRNILGREGEQGGVDFWAELIESGQVTQADALDFFVDSDENLALAEEILNIARNAEDGAWDAL
ncbi:MAG: DUF4214 domain-containing protein, partial [Pseudomonadota bacterium]